jgi:hypothetical protein
MKLAAILLVLAASPLANASTAAPFEGRIRLRLQDTTPTVANYAVRGDRVRVDVPSVGGAHDVRAVVDRARGTVAMTTPGGDTFVPAVMFPVLAEPDRVTVRPTGHWRAVVGQACEEWAINDDGRAVEACVVPGVPWFDPRRMAGGAVPGWSRALEARRAFPVSVWAAGDAKTVPFMMWATDVKPEPVTDESFAAPRHAFHDGRRPRSGP